MRGGSITGDSAQAARERERHRHINKDRQRQRDRERERERERDNMHKMKVTGKICNRTTVSSAIKVATNYSIERNTMKIGST